MISDPLFYLVAAPAVFLLGLGKGGFAGIGMLSLPLLALASSPLQAAALILPILLIQDVVSVSAYRRSWSGRNLAVLIPGSLAGVVLGYLLAARVSEAAVSVGVGAISILFALARLVIERGSAPVAARPGSVLGGLFWGAVSGFVSMIAHAGGPPYQVYIMPQRLPRDVFVGTGALFFAFTNWIKVPPFLALGQLTPGILMTAAALAPLAVASTFAGVALVRRVNPERFYAIIYGLLILVGGKLVWDGLARL